MYRRRGLKRISHFKDWASLILILAGCTLLAIVMPPWFWFFLLGVGLIVGGLFIRDKY